MMRKLVIAVVVALCVGAGFAGAAELTAAQKQKVQGQLDALQVLGKDAVVVKAVADANATPAEFAKSMTQDKWKALSIMSPEIKSLAKNALVDYLKTKKTEVITELFVSAKDGTKVAFFAKTSSWSHKGKDKHEVPMKGKTWIGEPEQDESTGKIQVQVAFPVISGDVVIGSIVVGLDISKL